MKSVKIGDIVIGESERPLVIPEMGINHEGSLETAKEMVDAAHRAGARIIKHQTHIVEDEMSGAAKKVIPGNADVSIYEIMNRCALSEEEEKELIKSKIKLQQDRRKKYETLDTELKNSNDTQISLTDKDSRALMLTNNVSGVEYAVQAAFDSKHKLLVHSHIG